MLLAHIDDLIKTEREFRFPFELYEEMVEAWLEREKGFISETNKLREFSERLAVNLYLNSGKRKSEQVAKDELTDLAEQWNIRIDSWKLTGRSLLNRAGDEYKFAHRSIMEYLYVKRFADGDKETVQKEWTDQMDKFLWEMIYKEVTDFDGTVSRFCAYWAYDQLIRTISKYARRSNLQTKERKYILMTILERLLTDYGIWDNKSNELYRIKEVWDINRWSSEFHMRDHLPDIQVHLDHPGFDSKQFTLEIFDRPNPWADFGVVEVYSSDIASLKSYQRMFVDLKAKWLLCLQHDAKIPEQAMNKVLKLYSSIF
jgi:hypothetical protein